MMNKINSTTVTRRSKSSGMWHHVNWKVVTNVL